MSRNQKSQMYNTVLSIRNEKMNARCQLLFVHTRGWFPATLLTCCPWVDS
jgi:hypothetical protein